MEVEALLLGETSSPIVVGAVGLNLRRRSNTIMPIILRWCWAAQIKHLKNGQELPVWEEMNGF